MYEPATPDAQGTDGIAGLTWKSVIRHISSVVTKTANYTATSEDMLILADATAGPFTITLPAVATVKGKLIMVKKIDTTTNAVTLDGNGAELIDDFLTYVLNLWPRGVALWSDGTQWRILYHPFQEHVNVKDFGAIGDGVADDYLALRRARDFANSTKRPMYVPTGIYGVLTRESVNALTTMLQVKNDIPMIFGDGYNRSVIKNIGDIALNRGLYSAIADPLQNVVLKDFSIDMNIPAANIDGSTGTCLQFGDGTVAKNGIILDRMGFFNARAGAIGAANVSNLEITRCRSNLVRTFYDGKGVGNVLAQSVRIHHNEIYMGTDAAAQAGDAILFCGDDVLADHNYIQDCGDTLFDNGGVTVVCKRMKFLGNIAVNKTRPNGIGNGARISAGAIDCLYAGNTLENLASMFTADSSGGAADKVRVIGNVGNLLKSGVLIDGQVIGSVKKNTIIGDSRTVTDAAMSAASAVLTSASAAFNSGDVGKGIAVIGAGTTDRSQSDGVATASSAVITSASIVFTAADIGRRVKVNGAGAGGTDLITTIASVQSATQATMATAAQTSVNPATITIVNTLITTISTVDSGTQVTLAVSADTATSAASATYMTKANLATKVGAAVMVPRFGNVLGNDIENFDVGMSLLISGGRQIISKNFCKNIGAPGGLGKGFTDNGIDCTGLDLINNKFIGKLYNGATVPGSIGIGFSVAGSQSVQGELNSILPDLVHNLESFATKVNDGITHSSKKIQNNMGYKTEARVLSGTFAIDSTGVKTITITTGLDITPTFEECTPVIVKNTDVDDWVGTARVHSVGSDVVIKVNVSSASGTGGATAKIGLRVGRS